MKIFKIIGAFILMSFLFSLALVLGMNALTYLGDVQVGTDSESPWFNPINSLNESYASDYSTYGNDNGTAGYAYYSSDATKYGAQDISEAGYGYYVSDSNSYGYDETSGGYKFYTADQNKYAQYDSVENGSKYYESSSYDTDDVDAGYRFYSKDSDDSNMDNLDTGYAFYASDYANSDTDFK